MGPKSIEVGKTYTRGGTYINRVYDEQDKPDPSVGYPGSYEETTVPMTRVVLDLFNGASGSWVAFRLPWGEVRVNRLASFARWAKAVVE